MTAKSPDSILQDATGRAFSRQAGLAGKGWADANEARGVIQTKPYGFVPGRIAILLRVVGSIWPIDCEDSWLRYGVFGDIHGNLEALDAVLADMVQQRVEVYVCTGDIVGYGANPRECLRKVRDVSSIVIAGNHDHAVAEKLNIDFFNAYAKEAVIWTRRQITTEERDYLYGLPLLHQDDKYTVVHGTLNFPQMFDYIQTSYDAYLSLELLQTPVCFLGHSHVPITFYQDRTVELITDNFIELRKGRRYLVNVGSVGQPRDENPLSSYAVFDSDAMKVEIRRVPYDIETASRKIIEANLPTILAERLFYGR